MSQALNFHAYQRDVIARVYRELRLALFLDPGLGKTVIVLEAARRLIEDLDVSRVLVVAPLRPCYTVWPREVAKWSQFSGMGVRILHESTRKAKYLNGPERIVVINPEGLDWLGRQRWPSAPEMLVVDESTKFKRASSGRSHALQRLTAKHGFPRRYILTGTPSPNGEKDLHGQFLALDDGRRLGRTMTEFRDEFLVPVPTGDGHWSWTSRKSTAARVAALIQDVTIRLSARDHLDLPDLVQIDREVVMPTAARRLYDELERELVLEFARGDVTALNAGALTSKLRQMASGAVYTKDDKGVKDVEEIHEAKLEALVELIEELGGEPLLVAYAHEHEVRGIERALGATKPLPRIGGGVSAKAGAEHEAAWNRGEYPLMLVHPSSGGHGLNLQEGGGHVAWFSLPWDLELYDQFNGRLFRQGQRRERVMVHHLITVDTIDETIAATLRRKDRDQQDLLKSLQRYADTRMATITDPLLGDMA